jgi:hypothetical protein
MSYADDVRDHCRRTYIEPARQRGEGYVGIRAGDVHKDLKYSNRYPLVCSAIGANVFEEKYGIERVSVDGPLNGVNTMFWFKLKPGESFGGSSSSGTQKFRMIRICPMCGSNSEEPA